MRKILIIVFFILILPKKSFAAVCVDQTGQIIPGSTPPCGSNETVVAQITDLEIVFASIVSVVGILIGFTFFIMIIHGGVRYLLSGGDPKALQAAKGTLTWGIVGLALFALSFTILLIVQAFTGVNITIFQISV